MAIINGDDNPNILEGTPQDDTINGFGGDDVLYGGDFDRDNLNGGDGVDTVTYIDTRAVKVNLSNGTATVAGFYGDTLTGIENVIGSNNGDELTGDSGANVLRGEGGNDLLRGGAGADTLDGGDFGDTVTYFASASGVAVDLATGIGTGADAEGDILISIEGLTGSNFDGDSLAGNDSENFLSG